MERILQQLQRHDPDNKWRIATEFRHPSWYTVETYELLDGFDATIVLQDIPKAKMFEVRGKAAFVYIRFHGPKGNYRDSYNDSYLNQKAIQIREWLKEGKYLYAYFNNTIGNAYENAISLKTLLIEQ